VLHTNESTTLGLDPSGPAFLRLCFDWSLVSYYAFGDAINDIVHHVHLVGRNQALSLHVFHPSLVVLVFFNDEWLDLLARLQQLQTKFESSFQV